MATGRQIHADIPLSNLLVQAFEGQGDFVADKLFPVVPVDKQSNRYYKLKSEAWLSIPDTRRSPRTRANRIEFDVSTDSYFCDNFAIGAEIPLEDLANADSALNIRQSNTRLISRALMADWEQRVATQATTAGNHVATIVRQTGASAWDAVESADLIAQIGTGHDTIFSKTGLRPNVLLLDYQSYMYAKRNTRLASRFTLYGAGAGIPFVNDTQMAEAFMVDRILIARSQKNNANVSATASVTSIWGPTALLARVEGGMSLQTATYGLSMRWTDPNLGVPMAVTTAIEDQAGSRHIELLEGGYYQDEKLVAKDLGYLINTKSGTPW